MASIVIISGTQKGQYLPLGKRINVIGRAEALPMQVLDDMVSRKHLRIRYDLDTNQYLAEDMNSKHGVFINNIQIKSPTVLKEADVIVIGQTNLLFTDKEFEDSESVLEHYKKAGERQRPTVIE
jgi:pSer/pThr/pTyr-binding forkhead associated (FHA) protein